MTEDIVNFNLTIIRECIRDLPCARRETCLCPPSHSIPMAFFFFLIMYDVSCLERRFACAVKRQLYLLKNIISQNHIY